MTAKFTRRDFLKLSGAGLLGALTAGLRLDTAAAADFSGMQGRVIPDTVRVYDEPTEKSKLINVYWMDMVKPITGTALSENLDDHNRVWYRYNDEGYVYSGKIQPVRTELQKAAAGIRSGGMLAEISVPYTDAHSQADFASKVTYRLYYETTHWVDNIAKDANGDYWYSIWDDKLKQLYFAPAAHMRLLPDPELDPISPGLDPRLKLLEVNLTEQVLIAYETGKPVFMARCATGKADFSIFFSTPPGWYTTDRKRPTRHMASSDPASAEGFDLPGIPWVSYFTESGISFHGTYWHNDYGRPRSHGCINLTPQAAKWVYLWTHPIVRAEEQQAFKEKQGTNVHIVE
jgi:lipoprotein-anchoring transpeptidase ErfK/SrfK